jgi:tetratricopeptide (TPR) repeat protein
MNLTDNYDFGLSLARSGRIVEARRYFARAIDQNPNHPEAYYNLALTFHLRHETAKAIGFYRHAIALNPRYAEAWCNLGMVLHESEHLEEAAKAYAAALDANPDIPRARSYLGALLYGRNDADGARAAFHDVLRRQPDDALAHFTLGRMAYVARDLPVAIQHLSRALEGLIHESQILATAAPAERTRLSRYNVEDYPDALREAVKHLSAHGIEPILICGTLIGAMRENDFLWFDKDIDFGIDAKVTPEQLDLALRDCPDFRCRSSLNDDEILPSYIFREKVALDFFRIFSRGDKVWYGLHWNGEIVRWMHTPFRTVDFDWQGARVKIPEDFDSFLTECYGDWRTPDPYFATWASLNMDGHFPPVARAISYGQIFTAAWQGDREKTENLCRQALVLEPANATLAALRAKFEKPAGALAVALPQALGNTFDNLPG